MRFPLAAGMIFLFRSFFLVPKITYSEHIKVTFRRLHRLAQPWIPKLYRTVRQDEGFLLFRSHSKSLNRHVLNVLSRMVLGWKLYIPEFNIHDEYAYHLKSALHY